MILIAAMALDVLPLHKHFGYLMQCCELINDEWKRSETARLRSLESSRDELPTSLILIENEKKVIGHCKLTPIPAMTDACFIESVVISRDIRGKGYGKYLMEKAENYCRDFLDLKTIYLSTKGQEGFYAKLGYTECPPVSIYGGFVPFNNNNNSYSGNIVYNKSSNFRKEINVPAANDRKVYMKKDIK